MTDSRPPAPDGLATADRQDLEEAATVHFQWRVLISILILIFLSESLIMLVIGDSLPEMPFVLKAALDGFLITGLALPLTFYLLYRPMVSAMEKRGRAESELRLERNKLKKILDASEDGVYIVSKDYDIEYVNPSIEKQFGDWRGRKCHVYFHDREIPCLWCKNAEVFAGRSVRWEFHVAKNDRIYDLFDTPITNADGSVSKLEILHDITGRVRAEQERARLAVAIEQAGEAVLMTDQEGVILYVNPAFEQITGYSAAEAKGKTPGILKSGKHAPSFYTHMWDTIKAGSVWKDVFINKKKNGELYHVATTISPIRGDGGSITHYVGILRDITAEIEIEKRAMQSQKLQAIGTLSGGIAHDFNNILTAIIGHAEMSVLDAPSGSDMKHSLEQILNASARARDMVKRLLAFSRGSAMELKPVNLCAVVADTIKLVRAATPSTIEIRSSHCAKPCMAMGDPTQIGQVVMNLFANAEHSMRARGGVLDVSVKQVDIPATAPASAPNLLPGQYSVITVSDTGHGMPRDVMERIFEPFFTTKKVDEGVGLGLSVAHGIITGMGGAITVNSEPDKGTVFKVYIPRMAGEAEMDSETEAPPMRGSETILIVDDEPQLVDMWSRVFNRLGYKTLRATSPMDGLRIFSSSDAQIDLVVTDYAMPGMNGMDMAREIMKIRKGTPVILLTGYSSIVTQEEAKAVGIVEFAMKPVTTLEMSRMIRSALDGEGLASS
jgi:PAS domain S-box-containing protein